MTVLVWPSKLVRAKTDSALFGDGVGRGVGEIVVDGRVVGCVLAPSVGVEVGLEMGVGELLEVGDGEIEGVGLLLGGAITRGRLNTVREAFL